MSTINEKLAKLVDEPYSVLRKERFVKDLQEPTEELPIGGKFTDYFYLSDIQQKKTKRGSEYWSLKLTDRTGTIDARVWDKPKELVNMPKAGVYVKVLAETNEFNDSIQLIVKNIRPLAPATEGVAPEDFAPVGPHDRYKRIEEFKADIKHRVRNPGYRTLMLAVFEDYELYKGLRDCPGAKSKHQAYIGGLLDHIMQIYRNAFALWEAYDKSFDVDLLAAAALLHDLGKTLEIRYQNGIDLTVRGKLVGHVCDSMILLNFLSPHYWKGWENQHEAEKLAYFNAVERDEEGLPEIAPARPDYAKLQAGLEHLEHVIASHHGQRDWGAMRTPATREAWLFHLIDMIDARQGLYDSLENEPTDSEGFTGFNHDIGSRVWNPKKREYPIG